MKSRNAMVLAAVAIAVLASYAWLSGRSAGTVVSRSEFLMDTVVELKVRGPENAATERAISAAFDEMRRVDGLLSRYAKGSDTARINARAGRGTVPVSGEALTVIARASHYHGLTRGAFDATVGPLVDLWGFGTEKERVPGDDELRMALAVTDGGAVVIDRKARRVGLGMRGMSMDLGAIAKGYAVDRGIRALKGMGIKSAMINAGASSIAVFGGSEGNPWRIGIADPSREGELLGTVDLTEGCVGTSSGTQRYFVKEGVRYHHLLDPSNGKPSRLSRGITVIAPTAMDADALSTVGFVLGPEAALKLTGGMKGVRIVAVGPTGRVHRTKGFRIDPVD